MRRKPSATRHTVIVHNTQRPKLHMLRVKILRKRKRKPRIQPSMIRVPAFVALSNRNHFRVLPGSLPIHGCIIVVITTIVKRSVSPPLTPFPSPLYVLSLFLTCTSLSSLCSPFWCKVKDGLRLIHGFRHFHRRIEKDRRYRRSPRNHLHHRQSHRQVLRNSDHAWHHPRHGPPPNQSRCQRFRHDELRPRLQ